MLKDIMTRIRENVAAWGTKCTCEPKFKVRCVSCRSSLQAANDRADLLKIYEGLSGLTAKFVDTFKSTVASVINLEGADMDKVMDHLMDLHAQLPQEPWVVEGSHNRGPHAVRSGATKGENVICRFQLVRSNGDGSAAQSVELRRDASDFIASVFNVFPAIAEMYDTCKILKNGLVRLGKVIEENPPDALAKAKVILGEVLPKAG